MVCLAVDALCSSVFAQTASSETQRSASVGAEITFGSGHADRGFIVSDRPVIQPEVWVSDHGADVSLWSSFTLVETTDRSRPMILELELSHEVEWRRLTLTPSVTMVSYHDALSTAYDRTIETWLYLSYDLGPLQLITNHSLDILANAGAYHGEAGIQSEWHVSPALELGGSLGTGWASAKFNDDYAGARISALDYVSAEAWLTVHVSSRFYIGPHIEFSTIVDRRVRAGPDVVRPTYVLIGLATGGEF